MQEILRDFCQAVTQALENPHEDSFFLEMVGLCGNFNDYLYDRFGGDIDGNIINYFEEKLLETGNGNAVFPFNTDFDDYTDERFEGTLYKNPQRLNFIKKYANV